MRHASPRLRSWCAAALAVVLLATTGAGAGEVPSSAWGGSLLIPTELLDHPSLLFQYPQHGVLGPSELLATTTGSSDASSAATAAGARIRIGQHAVFLASQTTDPILSSLGSVRVFQVGWAAGAGPLRFGVAARAGHERAQREQLDVFLSFEADNPRIEETEEVYDLREVGIGIGLEADDVSVDVVVDLSHEDQDTDIFNRSSSGVVTSRDIENDAEIHAQIALRAAAKAGEKTTVQASARFREASQRVDLRAEGEEGINEASPSTYGHEWAAGFSVARLVREQTLGHFFVQYEDTQPGTSYDVSVHGYREASRRTETVRFGLGLEHPIWWDMTLLAGIRNSFVLTTNRSLSVQTNGDTFRNKTVSEFVEQGFAWGLHRAFDTITLAGSMRTDLDLSDPFFALDVRLHL